MKNSRQFVFLTKSEPIHLIKHHENILFDIDNIIVKLQAEPEISTYHIPFANDLFWKNIHELDIQRSF